jgi:hypothetical protein
VGHVASHAKCTGAGFGPELISGERIPPIGQPLFNLDLLQSVDRIVGLWSASRKLSVHGGISPVKSACRK